MFDLENDWVFATVSMTLWVAIFVFMETVVFDGDLFSGVIQGFFGGLVFAVAYRALRNRN